MFINCPNCNALVATDLVTDLPPLQCPRCDFGLRDMQARQVTVPTATDPVAVAPPPLLADPPGLAAPTAPMMPATPPAPGPKPAVRFIPLHEPPPSAALVPPSSPGFEPAETAAPPRDDAAGRATDAAASPSPHQDDEAPGDDAPPAPATARPTAAAGTPPPPATAPPPTQPAPSAAVGVDTPVAEATAPATSTSSPAPQAPASAPAPAATGAPAAPPSAQPAAGVRTAPSFLRTASPAAHALSPRERRVLRIAIPALTVLLVLQLLLADRVRLAGDATWRPWVAAACTLARCALPPWHAPDAITLVQRDVRPHPAQSGVLQVSATLRNDAAYPQAWPMLLLTLSDVDGRPLGARWFAPGEYRPTDAADILAPGAAAAFRIDVVEPSPHTVAFNFTFG